MTSYRMVQTDSDKFDSERFRQNIVMKYSDYYKIRKVQTIYQIQKDSETAEKFSHILESQFC